MSEVRECDRHGLFSGSLRRGCIRLGYVDLGGLVCR
jgi:hypothetical protein